jgi:glycosyltransferase involved in cell wall biosynthesis
VRDGRGARALAEYRDRHAGETVIVCGCGTSLRELELPVRETTIGVNDVGRLFDPTYLVVVNPPSQFSGDRFRYVAESRAQALFTQLDLGRVHAPVVRFRLGTYGGTQIGAADVLHYTQNSPYVAVCLAAYMGATRIGLIGVDLTGHHFFAPTGRHALAGRLREIDAQYGRLAAALARSGIELLNLSSVSRLTSLRRAHIAPAGGWIEQTTSRSRADATRIQPAARSTAMKIAVQKAPSSGAVGDLLNALADTAGQLGHRVLRDPQAIASDPRALAIVWNGRGYRARGSTLFCEHGWLPRSWYQISKRGINADSHAAPFSWNGVPLNAAQNAALDAHLEAIKAASFSGYYRYMEARTTPAEGLPPEFLLVPLQIEADTNIVRHAPPRLRTMQALIDRVAAADPPWPVIFKQHPADARRSGRHLQLRLRRRQDMIWLHARGNVHQMLNSGRCRGILTINSNVAHDGLLWDVPAIVLGANLWPRTGAHRPFLTEFPRDWNELHTSAAGAGTLACRRAYAWYLMMHQWSLDDARNSDKVAALIADAAPRAVVPRAPRVVVAPRAGNTPVINVVAQNRGWLFESWKQRLAVASLPGHRIVASKTPLRDAAAWIFIRAREAAATPDVAHTVVQLHDFADATHYAEGAERGCVADCAALSLTHPHQQDILVQAGIDPQARRSIVQPVGWSRDARIRPGAGAAAVAWIGRPARPADLETSGLAEFIDAVRRLRRRPRVVLVGERLERAAVAFRKLGVDCRLQTLRACPLDRATEWIGAFRCVVLGRTIDSAPWPLFDALYAGVPVIARPSGWAQLLLADGQCGRLCDDAVAISAAIDELIAADDIWRDRRSDLRARVADYSMSAWVQANLELAANIARRAAVHAA